MNGLKYFFKFYLEMPMEQVPVVEIDGKVFYQSKATGRYLAKKFGLYSNDELEAYHIDCAVDTIEDLRLRMFPIIQMYEY